MTFIYFEKLNRINGFTLLEMAIVLTIIGLISGLFLGPLSTLIDARNNNETKKTIALVKEALVGFSISQNRLPCPDNNGDGVEDLAEEIENNKPEISQSKKNYKCSSSEGFLPFKTLGVGGTDAWSNYIYYGVTNQFAEWDQVFNGLNNTGEMINSRFFTLSTLPDIKVKARGDNLVSKDVIEKKAGIDLTSACAIIISFGKNGHGATNVSGIKNSFIFLNGSDEAVNQSSAKEKIARDHTLNRNEQCHDEDENLPFCEFDDIVEWISPNVLFNRMIQAGKLP